MVSSLTLKTKLDFVFEGFRKWTIFDLRGLIDNLLVLHQLPKTLTIHCKFVSFSARRTTSSAYNRMVILIPLPYALILKAKSLIYRLNSTGESEQPYFKPLLTPNQSVKNPFSFTEHNILL